MGGGGGHRVYLEWELPRDRKSELVLRQGREAV